MKVAVLTTDNREQLRNYAEANPCFGAAPEAVLQGFSQMPGIEVHVISCTRQPMSSPEKLSDNIWFHSLLVPKVGWLTTGYQGCIRAVRHKLRKIQPDIVHGQGTERDCAMTAIFSGYLNVITIHGHMQAIRKHMNAQFPSYYWWCAHLERLAVAKTSGIFCNSKYTESLIAPLARRTWLVPNALRPEFFSQLKAPCSNTRPKFISVGVISDYKRQLQVLEIGRRLHDRGFRFLIVFVGAASMESPYCRRFFELLEPAKRDGFADYLGKMKASDLCELYDTSDAMIHVPSEESFGLVAAEALARNLKFFGSSVGGIIDIANGVDLAELYAPNDWEALELGIARWMRNGFEKPTEAAKEMRSRYHPDQIARQHLAIYEEVLRTRR